MDSKSVCNYANISRFTLLGSATSYYNNNFNFSFSPLRFLMSFSCSLSLTFALHFIFLAWSAYLNVDMVSSKLSLDGEIAQIIRVLLFPPRAFWRSLVNALSLKGTISFLFFDYSASTLITLPICILDINKY